MPKPSSPPSRPDPLITGGGLGGVAAPPAAHCLDNGLVPEQTHTDERRLAAFQDELVRDGRELHRPETKGY
ncbi:hypothetical protein [Streptomyces sp. NPDC001508]|uniref:hypothetical protein n=1 Tax=Streptomyces sp. NPDC001508 TaxID=3154656 RepID=UPI0033261E8E